MLQFLTDASEFAPHGFCLTWDRNLISLNMIANGLIFLSYMVIPIQIAWMIIKAATVLPHWALWLFVSFILLCGISHAIDIVTLFYPVYWLQTLELLLTGIVSMATAILLPAAIVLRNRYDKYEEAH